MEIKRVGLIGAGAVGAYFIAGLSDLLGENFIVLAEGERKQRLKERGLSINGRHCCLNVKSPEEAGDLDLLLICTKSYALPEAMDLIEASAGDHTVVMSLLNGIDSEEQIAKRIGPERIVWSVMRISSAWKEGGVWFDPAVTAGVTFAERGSSEKTPRLLAISDLFRKGGIHHRIVDDILRDQWGKYAGNITYNLPQALLGVGYGAYFKSEHVAFIRDRLFDEVSAVGKARGVDVPDLSFYTEKVAAPDARFSTLQDLDAHRRTEVDMFVGKLIEMAKEDDIPVPYCTYTWHAIRALEEKNAGLLPA